jgi:MtN3 and saliva related transmembrane protein
MRTAVGVLAGMLTTGAWLPQLWRSWTSRSCDGLSWAYLVAMVAGFLSWLAYGLLADAPAVVLTNVLSLGLAGSLIAIKVRQVGVVLDSSAGPTSVASGSAT